MRSTARRFGTSLLTVQRWVQRAGDRDLAGVDWSDRPSRPLRIRRVPAVVEDAVLRVRSVLRDESILGEFGPQAIQRALREDPSLADQVPSVRTIARILERRGALDGTRRIRRPAPPRGWYLPDVRARLVELDSFDVIEGHHLPGGAEIDVLTGVSLHGGLIGAWPGPPLRAAAIVSRLVEHWQEVGRPAYAQFDNDTRFHGSHAYADIVGPVVRLCLALEVVPVFAPPREHGFQAAIESFNGRWQTKVWARRRHETMDDLVSASARYVHAHQIRSASRIEAAPVRLAMPSPLPDIGPATAGRIVYLRRTTDAGRAIVLGRSYDVDRHWPHRLVRAELDFTTARLSFFGLRRRQPDDQPLLAIHDYGPVIEHNRPTRRC